MEQVCQINIQQNICIPVKIRYPIPSTVYHHVFLLNSHCWGILYTPFPDAFIQDIDICNISIPYKIQDIQHYTYII